MIKKAKKCGYLSAIMMSLAITTHAGAWAVNAPHLFLTADVDGDGKKDEFFRTFMPDRRVEIGVILSKSQGKYVKIYDDEIKIYRKSTFSIENRKPFLDHIKVGCDGGCPDYRVEAISILDKSISPVFVNVAYDFSAKVLYVNEKGEIAEVWYSD